jgi:hypothetical protein
MGRFELEQRDYEIMRTLARVHFLTSAEINEAYFSSEFAGYRRLRKLAQLNLIRRHTNGAPPRSNYCAWRLTSAGVAAVLRAFPEEPIREGLDDRLARQSLRDLAHREAASRLYLDLVRGPVDQRAIGPSCASVRAWIAQVRRRADLFRWYPDGEVRLTFPKWHHRQDVVPDATAATDGFRFFIEVDRSTKSLPRIEENLRGYQSYLRDNKSKKETWVIYVVHSEARAKNVAKLARSVLDDTLRWRVLLMGDEARAWLAVPLLGEDPVEQVPRAPKEPIDPVLRGHVTALLRSTSDLLTAEKDAFEAFTHLHPQIISAWKQSLKAVHDLIRADARPAAGGA